MFSLWCALWLANVDERKRLNKLKYLLCTLQTKRDNNTLTFRVIKLNIHGRSISGDFV